MLLVCIRGPALLLGRISWIDEMLLYPPEELWLWLGRWPLPDGRWALPLPLLRLWELILMGSGWKDGKC